MKSNLVDELKKVKVDKEFEMKNLGAVTRILRIDIKKDRKKGKLYLSQEMCLRKLLVKFGMSSSKAVTTLITKQFKLNTRRAFNTEAERTYMARTPYTSIICSLMYAIVSTRPYIAYDVSIVSKFMENPGKAHL